MKRPQEAVNELFIQFLETHRNNQKENFDNLEKFMVWIVGISFGGMSLMITNMEKVGKVMSYELSRTILTLLCLSIVTGIIYRITFALFISHYQLIQHNIRVDFSTAREYVTGYTELTGETDAQAVALLLKMHFDIDASDTLTEYEQADLEEKSRLLQHLKNRYRDAVSWAQDDVKAGMDRAKSIFQKHFEISAKRADKMINRRPAIGFKIFGALTILFFTTSILSFLTVIIMLVSMFH
jgi:hypothetical protein